MKAIRIKAILIKAIRNKATKSQTIRNNQEGATTAGATVEATAPANRRRVTAAAEEGEEEVTLPRAVSLTKTNASISGPTT